MKTEIELLTRITTSGRRAMKHPTLQDEIDALNRKTHFKVTAIEPVRFLTKKKPDVKKAVVRQKIPTPKIEKKENYQYQKPAPENPPREPKTKKCMNPGCKRHFETKRPDLDWYCSLDCKPKDDYGVESSSVGRQVFVQPRS